MAKSDEDAQHSAPDQLVHELDKNPELRLDRRPGVELSWVLERHIGMRIGRAVTLAVVVSFLAGCGDQGQGQSTRDESGVAGRVLLGPQCPVEIVGGDPCADAPAVAVNVTVSKQLPGELYAAGEVVARTTTDADGSFSVAVTPGEYVVTADAGMSCALMDARVADGAYTTVDIACDTGIR